MQVPNVSGFPILRRCARTRWQAMHLKDRVKLDKIFLEIMAMRRDDIDVEITTKRYGFGAVELYRLAVQEAQFLVMKEKEGSIAIVDFFFRSRSSFFDIPSINEIPA